MERRMWRAAPQAATLIAMALVTIGAGAKPVAGAKPIVGDIERVEFGGSAPPKDRVTALGVKLQVLLARSGYSPGEIDGRFSENTRKALRAYAGANGGTDSRELDSDLWSKLSPATGRPVLTRYQISASDLKGPFTRTIPTKLQAMKKLPYLGYRNPREELAERFHMSEHLLALLNPGERFTRAGDEITVVNVAEAAPPAAVRLEVDKTGQSVSAFGSDGQLLAFFPATVGSEDKPTPSGTLKVTSIDWNPVYRYDPSYHFKDVSVHRPFTVKPGPNNPVGVVWIGLSDRGYGIHGTPEPGKISKTQSHGCVRLTNWDASRVARMVRKGIEVHFIDDEASG